MNYIEFKALGLLKGLIKHIFTMENKQLFIGIDIAKLTFDVAVIKLGDINCHMSNSFENTKKGYRKMLKWLKNNFSEPLIPGHSAWNIQVCMLSISVVFLRTMAWPIVTNRP